MVLMQCLMRVWRAWEWVEATRCPPSPRWPSPDSPTCLLLAFHFDRVIRYQLLLISYQEELVFEDPFEDEFEEESFEDAYESDAEMGDAEENEGGKDEKEMIQDDEGNESAQRKVWLPSQTPLQPGETLEYDSDAYDVIHFLTTEWPCLSFDVLPDKLGMMRKKYPHTLFLAAGTQADRAQANKIVLLRLSQLSKTRESGSDSDDGALNLDADDSGEEEDPIIEHRDIPHAHGCVNRLRVMPQAPHIVATMADNAQATIFDAKHALLALEGGISRAPSKAGQALFHFKHDAEGYALAWNVKTEGRLLTGDCNGVIRHWSPLEGGRWAIDGESFSGHADSVEDVQWSPSEADVFASCSVDKTVRLWDTRKGHAPVATLRAHNTDVNVMSWNACAFLFSLLASHHISPR